MQGSRVGSSVLRGAAWAAWGLGAAVAARLVVLGAARLVSRSQGLWHREVGPFTDAMPFVLMAAGGALAGALAFARARGAWAGASPGARRAGLGLAALAVVGLVVAHHGWQVRNGAFRWGFVPPPGERGFPFEPGISWTVTRGDFTGEVHTDEAGFRVCEPGPPPSGARKVALIGDSFVFGQALDDDASLCRALRRRLDAVGAAPVWLRNAGQPGAGVHSYDAMLEHVVGRGEADVAFVGLLVPDDAHVLDVNRHRVLRDRPVFRLLGSLLTPEDAIELAIGLDKLWRSEGFAWVSLRQGLRELAATSDRLGTPTVWFVWSREDSSDNSFYDAYVALAAEVAEASPSTTFLGVLAHPVGGAPGTWRIAGDGHPTPAAVEAYAERLLPRVRGEGEAP